MFFSSLPACQVLRLAQSDTQVCAWFFDRCAYRREGGGGVKKSNTDGDMGELLILCCARGICCAFGQLRSG